MPVIIFHRKNSPVVIPKLRHCMEVILSYLGQEKAMLEINLVGNTTMRSLNKKYRKKDRVTDVLSFPLDLREPSKNFPWHLGEIIIATTVAKRQAHQAKRSLTSQVIRLAVHGLVHLNGLDHEENSAEFQKFQAMESRCLHRLKKKGIFSWDGSLQL